MNKPQLKPRYAYDYHECEKYIAHLLKVKSLRKKDEDFWHFIVDDCDVHNGCYIAIPQGWGGWQKKIVDAFNKEFGAEAKYWVEW